MQVRRILWSWGLWAVLSASTTLSHGATNVPLVQRLKAAQTVADKSPACQAAQPFYWEIGDAHASLAHGRVGAAAPTPQTKLAIASASKWLFAAYVAERRQGQLSPSDIDLLTFRSGYTQFRVCRAGQTVEACRSSWLNRRGEQDADTVGRFFYSGGHMQQLAVSLGLGPLDANGLALKVRRELAPEGVPWDISYGQAQLAGGVQTTSQVYAQFLQGLLSGRLQLGSLLGQHAVCTRAQDCPDQALRSPIPEQEAWHYALGHWVEDDPTVGDGAFSSPGAFGFYPWIDSGKQYYGIVARETRKGILMGDEDDKPAMQSVACGRQIRRAWLSGRAE